jgi:hypothetical protein
MNQSDTWQYSTRVNPRVTSADAHHVGLFQRGNPDFVLEMSKKQYNQGTQQECRFRDMRIRDLIAAVKLRSDMDR